MSIGEIKAVSIPYERESLSKGMEGNGKSSRAFQFPTNGKAYPKAKGSVSGKISFNSLRTGKPIQRKSAGKGNSENRTL